MLKKDYDKAMGHKSTKAEYRAASIVYEEGAWVNKTEFLSDWKNLPAKAKESLINLVNQKREMQESIAVINYMEANW